MENSKHISGDLSVGRNTNIGGSVNIQGNATIGHNLKVKGWVEAPNIKDINKGVFVSYQELLVHYPTPNDGWLAGVVETITDDVSQETTTQITAYLGIGGQWVKQDFALDVNMDAEQLKRQESNLFVNVTNLFELVEDKTLTEILGLIDGMEETVAALYKVPGVVLTFLGENGWETWRWDGESLEDWDDESTWVDADAVRLEKFATGEKVNDVGIDSTPTSESDNLVKSGGVHNFVYEKREVITCDSDKDFSISDENSNDIVQFDNGHIKTKNFNSASVLEEMNKMPLIADAGDDFSISDENGNAILKINNGEVITRNFNSSDIKAKDGFDKSFAISDDNNNDIVQFLGGHIKTKNFDSSKVISELKHVPFNLFRMNLNTLSGVLSTGWTLDSAESPTYISNGTNYGWDNKLIVDKENDISDKWWLFDFKVLSGATAYFGSVGSIYNTTSGKQSLISIDFVNGKFKIHNAVPVPFVDIPSACVTENVSIASYTSKKFRIAISRASRCLVAKLYDITTSPQLLYDISCNFAGDGTPCGLMYDRPCVFSTDASIMVYNIEMNVPLPSDRKCQILIEGDSITEGWKTDEDVSYGHLLAVCYPDLAVKVSGRGNGSIRNLIDSSTPTYSRLAVEAFPLKPSYVMVTIGTNDYSIRENFSTYLQNIIDYVCTTIGARLILNHIPQMDDERPVTSTINTLIDSAILANADKDILCCKFDVCTSLNYDVAQGQDSSLFADANHPNAAGYQRMFEQIKIDCPELFNF